MPTHQPYRHRTPRRVRPLASAARPTYWNDTALAILAIAAILILLLSACSSIPAASEQPAATEQPATNENPPQDAPGTPAGVGVGAPLNTVDDLTAALQGEGASAEAGEPVDSPLFGAQPQVLRVNGQDLQVFEFRDEAAQQAAAATIQANGYIIGTAAVDWMTQPFFFAKDNLIVLYVGTDPGMVELLTGLLGDPVTSPDTWNK